MAHEEVAVSVPEPVAVGLVGAGPWASWVHAPVLAAGPETRLVGVWSRTAAKADALAAAHGAEAMASFEALLDTCEAVAFSVPPAVQADLAARAARRGKAVLLEKPLAEDLAGAERLAEAVGSAGVASLVVLSYRFAEPVRQFLEAARSFDALGGRACFLSGAFLGGPFATGWRLERGAVLAIGPHVLDLVDAALGPIVGLRAMGDRHGFVAVAAQHDAGATSDVALCCRAGIDSRTEIELFGPSGTLAVDGRGAVGPASFAELRRVFAAAVRDGTPHETDVHRGLHLQRLIAEIEAQLPA
ncbi:Gfo/Idh/MocA family oxidoreductase [soil metagenome]